MGFLSRMIKDAVSDGISKGIKDAVGKAAESIVAPKAEAYANKVAESIDSATKDLSVAVASAQAAEVSEDLAKEWAEKVPGFPVWPFGGSDWWFSENGTSSDGNTYFLFNVEEATEEQLEIYSALLKKEGFVGKYENPDWDDIMYKDLGGEYLVFIKCDAFNAAPVMTIAMFRTKDRNEFNR